MQYSTPTRSMVPASASEPYGWQAHQWQASLTPDRHGPTHHHAYQHDQRNRQHTHQQPQQRRQRTPASSHRSPFYVSAAASPPLKPARPTVEARITPQSIARAIIQQQQEMQSAYAHPHYSALTSPVQLHYHHHDGPTMTPASPSTFAFTPISPSQFASILRPPAPVPPPTRATSREETHLARTVVKPIPKPAAMVTTPTPVPLTPAFSSVPAAGSFSAQHTDVVELLRTLQRIDPQGDHGFIQQLAVQCKEGPRHLHVNGRTTSAPAAPSQFQPYRAASLPRAATQIYEMEEEEIPFSQTQAPVSSRYEVSLQPPTSTRASPIVPSTPIFSPAPVQVPATPAMLSPPHQLPSAQVLTPHQAAEKLGALHPPSAASSRTPTGSHQSSPLRQQPPALTSTLSQANASASTSSTPVILPIPQSPSTAVSPAAIAPIPVRSDDSLELQDQFDEMYLAEEEEDPIRELLVASRAAHAAREEKATTSAPSEAGQLSPSLLIPRHPAPAAAAAAVSAGIPAAAAPSLRASPPQQVDIPPRVPRSVSDADVQTADAQPHPGVHFRADELKSPHQSTSSTSASRPSSANLRPSATSSVSISPRRTAAMSTGSESNWLLQAAQDVAREVDALHLDSPGKPNDASAQQSSPIESAFRSIANDDHAHGREVPAAAVPPSVSYSSPLLQAVRRSSISSEVSAALRTPRSISPALSAASSLTAGGQYSPQAARRRAQIRIKEKKEKERLATAAAAGAAASSDALADGSKQANSFDRAKTYGQKVRSQSTTPAPGVGASNPPSRSRTPTAILATRADVDFSTSQSKSSPTSPRVWLGTSPQDHPLEPDHFEPSIFSPEALALAEAEAEAARAAEEERRVHSPDRSTSHTPPQPLSQAQSRSHSVLESVDERPIKSADRPVRTRPRDASLSPHPRRASGPASPYQHAVTMSPPRIPGSSQSWQPMTPYRESNPPSRDKTPASTGSRSQARTSDLRSQSRSPRSQRHSAYASRSHSPQPMDGSSGYMPRDRYDRDLPGSGGATPPLTQLSRRASMKRSANQQAPEATMSQLVLTYKESQDESEPPEDGPAAHRADRLYDDDDSQPPPPGAVPEHHHRRPHFENRLPGREKDGPYEYVPDHHHHGEYTRPEEEEDQPRNGWKRTKASTAPGTRGDRPATSKDATAVGRLKPFYAAQYARHAVGSSASSTASTVAPRSDRPLVAAAWKRSKVQLAAGGPSHLPDDGQSLDAPPMNGTNLAARHPDHSRGSSPMSHAHVSRSNSASKLSPGYRRFSPGYPGAYSSSRPGSALGAPASGSQSGSRGASPLRPSSAASVGFVGLNREFRFSPATNKNPRFQHVESVVHAQIMAPPATGVARLMAIEKSKDEADRRREEAEWQQQHMVNSPPPVKELSAAEKRAERQAREERQRQRDLARADRHRGNIVIEVASEPAPAPQVAAKTKSASAIPPLALTNYKRAPPTIMSPPPPAAKTRTRERQANDRHVAVEIEPAANSAPTPPAAAPAAPAAVSSAPLPAALHLSGSSLPARPSGIPRTPSRSSIGLVPGSSPSARARPSTPSRIPIRSPSQ